MVVADVHVLRPGSSISAWPGLVISTAPSASIRVSVPERTTACTRAG
ncbi:hypothetical protein [Kitasatospora mediocidica]|nr:hypothetical protein [Kitasatospora mediocidica]